MSISQNMKDAEYAWEATMEMENKEMSPLEAMEYIENPFIDFKDKQQYFSIVKAALYKLAINMDIAGFAFKKEMKALKIIKDKNVNCILVKQCKNALQYNKVASKQGVNGAQHLFLTQEEFSQLKEVL